MHPLPLTATAHSRQKRAPRPGGGKMSTRSSVNPVTAAAALSLSDRTRASIAVSQVAEPRPEGLFCAGEGCVLSRPRLVFSSSYTFLRRPRWSPNDGAAGCFCTLLRHCELASSPLGFRDIYLHRDGLLLQCA